MTTLTEYAGSVVSRVMRRHKPTRGTFAAKLHAKIGDMSYAEAAARIRVSRRTLENWACERTVPDRIVQEAALERLR